MPIGYEYDPATRLVHTKVGSELSLAELVNHLRAMNNDDSLERGSIEIVSLEGINDFAVRGSDLHGIESVLQDFVAESAVVGTIFVGGEPLQFGVANMLSGMLKTLFPDFRAPVVRSLEEALEEADALRGGSNVREKTP